nr:response regulator transcription factor [uncultured Cellulosilyticum sp.]
MFQILVVEDNNALCELFCTVLDRHGFKAYAARNGVEAWDILDVEYIDLIISDIMMPEMDGYEFIKSVRRSGSTIPILIITAKNRFEDMENGFKIGTDDYMVKPVNVNEMVLRVNALLRRAQIVNSKRLKIGEMELLYDEQTVISDNKSLELPQKEFNLLFKLLSNLNRCFTKQQIMDEIWGLETDSTLHTVDVHISKLRDRFKDNPYFEIKTIRGLGYKAVPKDE